jgi:thioredoxin-like negative regulator of GroEL
MANEPTENEMKEFLQKMGKKSEALKTSVETMADDSFNNMLGVIQKLWTILTEKNNMVNKLQQDIKKLKDEYEPEQKENNINE